MKSHEIRKRFLEFFEKRKHSIIPSASLVPENDPSVLFTTAGMQPLVPYLLGEKHPAGTRLANSQKCLRTVDIDEVGDNTHNTFFEMLGNWSLGDYFKRETIQWSYEFLTSVDEGLGLDPKRLYVTCFEGNEDAPKDLESAEIWTEIFKKAGLDPNNRIFFMPAENNWWSPGENGPCGPDTEMFYDLTGELTEGLTKEEYLKADEEQKVVEISNNVFMEYESKDGKVIGKLEQRNVDMGAGLERLTTVIQGKRSIFETDFFATVLDILKTKIENKTEESKKDIKIVSDHIRSSMFLVSDGVTPSNTDQGYILRRLIRRAAYKMYKNLVVDTDWIEEIVAEYVKVYGDHYKELEKNQKDIIEKIETEVNRFYNTLKQAVKVLDKITQGDSKEISGEDAFLLVTTHGMPFELLVEIAKEKNYEIDVEGFNKEFKKHQEKSKSGAEKKFKGGLAGTGEMEIKYHTATHLLNAALRKVLGEHVEQRGSNITSERLRFDFSHDEKMTEKEKQRVADLVNEAIEKDYPVTFEEMPIEKAKELGAIGVFEDKYGDVVKVYTVGNEETGIFSRELCGGPHVENTGMLGEFKIKKEEASSAGIRRIKAVLL
jgi:alanyl-tRNA synthetase